MDIFGILTMVGGLALFLYGMNAMGDGLAKLSGGRLERILERLTSKRIKALLLGALVTAVIQSSSATTVMVVGFVNSGIMQLKQAVGIIMGANIGTTITSWLLSLTGIQGDNIWIKLLKPSSFSPILAVIGIILTMFAKNDDKKKDIGNIMVGFAILMYGMETMSGAVEPLAQNESFTNMLTMFSNPILGMLAGAILTAIIQSSSASVGILQALCATGAVGFGTAIPIIMGQNIGTCVTAVISSIGANKNAKRASMIHLYFNLIGTLIFMVVFYSVNALVHFSFLNDAVSPWQIAVVHSLFNIGCAIILFPFANGLVRLAELTIPEGAKNKETDKKETLPQPLAALDERFIDKPAFAMQISVSAAEQMAIVTNETLEVALELTSAFSKKKAKKVEEMEQLVDKYEDILGSYLIKLSAKDLSLADSRRLSVLLHCIRDLERISDHAINISELMKEMDDKKLSFSGKAKDELVVFTGAVSDIVEKTVRIFIANDIAEARHIEPLEEVIDRLQVKIRDHHIKRLRKGKCTVELGIIFEDLITNLERISDHCSNIGVCMIQVSEDSLDTHEYLAQDIRKGDGFVSEFEALQKKYTLS
mgnify:FL=1